MSAKTKVNKKYVLVAPDGGWGYMICVAFIINNATASMFIGSFGLLFNDFMIQTGVVSTGATLLAGLNALSCAAAGFFSSPLSKLLGLRKMAFLAALILDAGTIGMIFANSYITFSICQGILPGIALGITYSLSCGIMNDYFVKRRMLAYSVVQFAVAAITMLTPMFVKWSLEHYGFRGTLLLIAGITIHNVVGVLLMQPVAWHMKKVEVVDSAETHVLLTEIEEKHDINVETEAVAEKPGFVLGNVNDKANNIRIWIEKFLDIKFFMKFIKTCVCIGPAVGAFVEQTFAMLLPQALYSMRWDQNMAALALSFYCFGDMAMRTALIFTSKWILKLGSQEAYILGLVIATVGKLGMIWSEKEIPIYAYLVLMGIARCFIFVILTEVVSDAVPPENFTQAMGLYMMLSGIITIVIGPAIGTTRDLTNSYSTAFYILTSFFAIMILFWSIEIVYKRNKDKRNMQNETAAKPSQLNKVK